jgi:long-subunit acyl-CoA synthetase (AMP-forming)
MTQQRAQPHRTCAVETLTLRAAILSDRWQPGDELTDTLKLRRQRITAKYAVQITSLYT